MRRPLNPFHLPGLETIQLLCPWRHPGHHELYVDIDNTEQAFTEFVRYMGDLAVLRADGQLVLVTGDSGCGKSALINRCAGWTCAKLREMGCAGEVVDLTRTLNGMPQREIRDRLNITCSALFTELEVEEALKPDVVNQLKPDRDQPGQVFPHLRRALIDDRILIILLPNPGELENEVIRYAGLARGGILFLVESALLDERAVEEIRRAQRDGISPITLRVGELKTGDARRFVNHRLEIHSNNGIYPRLSGTAMDSVARLRSIGQLQGTLSETYEIRRRSGLPYDEHSLVTYDEIQQQRRSWWRNGP